MGNDLSLPTAPPPLATGVSEAPSPSTAPSPPPAPAGLESQGEADALPQALEALGWLGGIGLSCGLFVAMLVWRASIPQYVSTNRVPPGERAGILAVMGCGMLLAVAPALVLMWRQRQAGIALARRWALTLSPLTATGFIPCLLSVDAWFGWPNSEISVATLITLVSLLGVGTLRQSLAQPAVLPESLRARRDRALGYFAARPALAFALAAGAALFYATWFTVFSLYNHYHLHTTSYDLGIEDNLMWNISHLSVPFRSTPLGGGYSHLPYHQTWISYLFVPFYLLVQDARFLLVLQACWLATGAVTLFLLVRHYLGAWIGCLFAWLYVLYPPLHGANLYDIHYQPFSIPLLFALVYFMERGCTRRALACVAFTLLIREDMGLLIATVSVWLALRGRRPGYALGLGAFGLVHFVLLKMIIMPRFLGGGESFINQYAMLLPEGDSGFGGVLKTVLANPGYTAAWLVEPGKLLYVLQVLGPLLFIPLMRRSNLVLMLPGFFFTLLSTKYPALISIAFQYSAYWVPFVFIATAVTLVQLKTGNRVLGAALLAALPLATILYTRQFGGVLKVDHVHGAFHTDLHLGSSAAEREQHDQLYALIAQIPKDAPLTASEQIVPHVSARRDCYVMRWSVDNSEWILAMNPVRGDEAPTLRTNLGPGGKFGVVDIRGSFVLAKKGAPHERNAEAQRVLGF